MPQDNTFVLTPQNFAGAVGNHAGTATINLANWSLQLPVDAQGGTSGPATEVRPIGSYSHPTFFHPDGGGGLVLSAPVVGAKTAQATHTRTELREMDHAKEAGWSVSQGGTLTAELAIGAVPRKADGTPAPVVIGQVHGKSDELCRLYYESGTVTFEDAHGGGAGGTGKFPLRDALGHQPRINLGETFDYVIKVGSGRLAVSVLAGGAAYSASEPINPTWGSDRLYFKAGAYNQVGPPASGASTVDFRQLTVSHP